MEHASPYSPIQALASLMSGRRTLVLSGAGISTESGIPDCRGSRGTLRNRRPRGDRLAGAARGDYRRDHAECGEPTLVRGTPRHLILPTLSEGGAAAPFADWYFNPTTAPRACAPLSAPPRSPSRRGRGRRAPSACRHPDGLLYEYGRAPLFARATPARGSGRVLRSKSSARAGAP